MKLTDKQKKIQKKMLDSLTDYERNREASHIELMNTFLVLESLKKFKKNRKKIKKSKRVLGQGTKDKQTVKFPKAARLALYSKRYVKYKGVKKSQ